MAARLPQATFARWQRGGRWEGGGGEGGGGGGGGRAAGGAGSHLSKAKQSGAIKAPSAAGSVECEDGLQHTSFHLPHEDPGNATGVVKVEHSALPGRSTP